MIPERVICMIIGHSFNLVSDPVLGESALSYQFKTCGRCGFKKNKDMQIEPKVIE